MINLQNVTRKYGDFFAVNEVSFDISQGEIVGLLGHNGAGKTTIMKMMTGFLEPTDGRITINGHEIGVNRQFPQRDIGYLPENCPVYPEMSVIDYLDYAACLHGVKDKDRPKLIAEAIARTELADKATKQVSTLSRGYRQRTGVAQAILHKPKILILDEPTNGLDPTQIQHMRSLITELAANSTVIIATHILQEVQAICDRVIILKDGKKALDITLEDLQKSSRLLVTVDTGPEQATSFFKSREHVLNAEVIPVSHETASGFCYALTLDENVPSHKTAASIADGIHDNNWQLYSLTNESRNLESVFAEISAS